MLARSEYSRKTLLLMFVLTLCYATTLTPAGAAQETNPTAPLVTKVEPPSWWAGLTPDLMLLLSGKNLQATHVRCNEKEVNIERTQATANGDYLFVWLKFDAELKSGTAVCRITTKSGQTNFELPIAARKQLLKRNQGVSLDDVIYLIMPDRFANGDPTNDEPAEFPGSHDRAKPRAFHGGDLRGIREKLPYLKDLGVTAIWLTPFVKNGATEDYHGYGAVDLYSVDPHFGTVEDYRELVDAAHHLQMKVLFDVVPNHVGPKNPWVKNPPLADWFHGTLQDHINSGPPINGGFYGQPEKKVITNDLFEALGDPHTPKQLRENLTDGWFFGLLPDMNTENPVVEQYLIQNAIWWAETSGLDAYRIDTFPYVPRKFWQDWHTSLRKIYPRLSTIGEIFHPDPTVTSFYAGGRKGWDGIDTGLTTPFDFPTFFAVREVLLHDAPAGKLANVLRQDSLYPHPEYLVPFFANHDTVRFAGEPGATPSKEKLAFGLVLTLRGIPEIYYGDEIGMAGGGDPDNRHDFPGGWTEDRQNAFTAEGRTKEQQEIFQYVRTLLAQRKDHSALRGGSLTHLFADQTGYVFLREAEEEKLLVGFNKDAQARTITLSLKDTPAEGTAGVESIFGGGSANLHGKQLELKLPAESLTIYQLR